MEFEEIYRTYFQDVFKYIRGLTADEHLAEEITSETFFKAFKAIDNFKGDCDVRVWLCQIAKNTLFTHANKNKRVINIEDESVIEQTQEGIEHMLVNKEAAFEIHQSLHKLKEPYKEVFSLRIFGELSFKQIALLFGKSEHWACVTFHRAKEMIRREMEHEN
ncbi:MAG: sigma-70 family RNA polymerase sigma factor [Lachnospiraceae bacterium]|nr:sigma-70 family RNA polymerase sigma factor [Lachnospiraceae bacterium]